MSQVSIAEARNHFPRLVQQAEAGEAVQITRRGRLVAVLLSQEEYGRLRGERTGFMDFLSQWRAEAMKGDSCFVNEGDFENLRDNASRREVTWNCVSSFCWIPVSCALWLGRERAPNRKRA